MLTQEQRAYYEEWGYVRIPEAIGRDAADAMASFIWDRLSELHGILQDDPRTWHVDAPWGGLKRFKDNPVFRALGSEVSSAAIDDLLGSGMWDKPKTWGGFLIKFPDRPYENWDLPVDTYWHVDFHFTYQPGTAFGLRVFSFLSLVLPRGGATLVVSGSHRLVEQFVLSLTLEERRTGFAVLRDRFNRSNPWLARVTSPETDGADRTGVFMHQAAIVDGFPVRVEELCADAGDVILMHPWLLHAASPNASDRPRLMVAKDIFTKCLTYSPSLG